MSEPLRCPACSASMNPLVLAGITADRCSHCDGTWFDVRELEAYFEASGLAPLRKLPQAPPHDSGNPQPLGEPPRSFRAP